MRIPEHVTCQLMSVLALGIALLSVYPIRLCISWDTYKEEHTITNWKPQFCPAQKEPLIEDGRLSGIRGFRDGPRFEFFLNVSRMRHPVTTVAQ